MMECEIGSRTCMDEEGESHTFYYYLLSHEVLTDEFSCDDFGVKIVSSSGTSVSITNITPSYTRIMELMQVLTENIVTPTNLPEVIEDWL